MTDSDKKNSFRENFEAHLESPIPILSRLRNLIFGKETPDAYTQVSFYLGIVIWLIFLIWIILGYVVLTNTEWIEQEKGLDVHSLIESRGQALGFIGTDFQSSLITFYNIALITWTGIFIGLALQWRKRTYFIYFIWISGGVYLLSMWFLLGFSYWYNDTTTFDKIAFFLFIGHSSLHYYFLNREANGDSTNFFGIEEED
ncbi:hypothetical protein [Fluviicola taffensis]|uniref:Uncharacterized protein n=1 Tax=Fluviicola taffensis (strain DSM 16823 / NCIMB 13979 / RW262) TaxID=755732 RepID=F2IKI7_FLUTR|nr:hypothetical protein [Fluviicola taffensis]AEA45113.1 hypothetical protein Fluta_3139 [Fluviicola taffensis DSM 16823]